jgi:hypothetical protein
MKKIAAGLDTNAGKFGFTEGVCVGLIMKMR